MFPNTVPHMLYSNTTTFNMTYFIQCLKLL